MTTYLITGARGGLGAAIAKRAAGKGVVIALVDSIVDDEMHRIAGSCKDAGAEIMIRRIDVRNGPDIEAFVKEFAASQGRLDVVISCAGVGTSIDDNGISVESARRIAEVNYFGAINTFLPAAKIMKDQGCGSLISINSIGALVSTPNSAAYSASKAALKMWLDSLRLRLRGSGVKITDIVLGFVETPMIEGLAHARLLSISPDRAASRILKAGRNGVPAASIPFLQNVPWWLVRMIPITTRNYFLTRIRMQIYSNDARS